MTQKLQLHGKKKINEIKKYINFYVKKLISRLQFLNPVYYNYYIRYNN